MGTIYFLRLGESGYIKIGFTRGLRNRLIKLGYELGEFEVLGIMPGTMQDEADLHQEFKEFAVSPEEASGSHESFFPDPQILSFVESETNTSKAKQEMKALEIRKWRVSRNRRRISNRLAEQMRKEYDRLRPPVEGLADKYRVSPHYVRRALLGKNHKHAGGPIQDELPDGA